MDPDLEKVLKDVQQAIDESDQFKDAYKVDREGARRDNDWWFIPVHLVHPMPNARRFELYAKFADLESYLEQRGQKVLLIPVISKYMSASCMAQSRSRFAGMYGSIQRNSVASRQCFSRRLPLPGLN